MKKARSWLYFIEIITDADYAVDVVLLSVIRTLAESLLHSLEQVAGDIDLNVNVNKKMYFEQKENISTQSSKPLKLEDEFPSLGSNISATETNVSIPLAKAWYAIDRISILWKSDLSDRIKQDFFRA